MSFSLSGFFSLAAAVLMSSIGTAQERIAQDPHDELRSANQAKIRELAKNCTGKVQDEAAKACPHSCMITVPNATLATADSCAPRTWTCAWPRQSVGQTRECPSGWSGTYTVDEIYEVQNCGKKLVLSGEPVVTGVNCTRAYHESRLDACPAGMSGSGVSYSRVRSERLETDLKTSKTAISAWENDGYNCYYPASGSSSGGGAAPDGGPVAADGGPVYIDPGPSTPTVNYCYPNCPSTFVFTCEMLGTCTRELTCQERGDCPQVRETTCEERGDCPVFVEPVCVPTEWNACGSGSSGWGGNDNMQGGNSTDNTGGSYGAGGEGVEGGGLGGP